MDLRSSQLRPLVIRPRPGDLHHRQKRLPVARQDPRAQSAIHAVQQPVALHQVPHEPTPARPRAGDVVAFGADAPAHDGLTPRRAAGPVLAAAVPANTGGRRGGRRYGYCLFGFWCG